MPQQQGKPFKSIGCNGGPSKHSKFWRRPADFAMPKKISFICKILRKWQLLFWPWQLETKPRSMTQCGKLPNDITLDKSKTKTCTSSFSNEVSITQTGPPSHKLHPQCLGQATADDQRPNLCTAHHASLLVGPLPAHQGTLHPIPASDTSSTSAHHTHPRCCFVLTPSPAYSLP